MRKFLVVCSLLVASSGSFGTAAPDGLWQGYDGEWRHVSSQLLSLAEAIPPDKFNWRPAPGVRSTSEVFMHVALANFMLLAATGQKMPADVTPDLKETSVTSKPEVIQWLRRSLTAVRESHPKLTRSDLDRRVKISDTNATVDGIYLRILIHANEHMGQLVAYARTNGITPPWAEESKKQ